MECLKLQSSVLDKIKPSRATTLKRAYKTYYIKYPL
uniref:Uncharacterized protein n=1 Tax=Caudovirales sp. ctTqA28 TaxID=2826775 RepID=A0A8S5MDJ4_9CAUD|nr:MAG TPA: hypothetical protein [Caudovirales sp. ctTqA28]